MGPSAARSGQLPAEHSRAQCSAQRSSGYTALAARLGVSRRPKRKPALPLPCNLWKDENGSNHNSADQHALLKGSNLQRIFYVLDGLLYLVVYVHLIFLDGGATTSRQLEAMLATVFFRGSGRGKAPVQSSKTCIAKSELCWAALDVSPPPPAGSGFGHLLRQVLPAAGQEI